MQNDDKNPQWTLSELELWAFAEFANDCLPTVWEEVEEYLCRCTDDCTRPDVVVVRHLLNWHAANNDHEDEIVVELAKQLLGASWPAIMKLVNLADQALAKRPKNVWVWLCDKENELPISEHEVKGTNT